MAKFLVFGDSIAYGSWDEEGGWVQRLRKFIEKKYPEEHLIYNMSVSADTTDSLLKRFESESNHRFEGKRKERFVFMFQIGANDSASLFKEDWVKPEKFEKNITQIIKLAKNYSKEIIFIGLNPVDENKTQPVPWDKRVVYKNENIKKYEDIIKEACTDESVIFIGIFNVFLKSDYKRLLQDGLHPNSEGHQKIFEVVKDFLIKNKII